MATTSIVVARSLTRRHLRDALHHLRVQTWLHPRPAWDSASPSKCMCCRGGIHRERDVHPGDGLVARVPTVRPISATAARWAAMQASERVASMACVTTRLRRQVADDGAQAEVARDEAAHALTVYRRLDIRDHHRPPLHRLPWERRRCALEYRLACDEAWRARRRALESLNFLAWWVGFAAALHKREARAQRKRRASEAAAVRVRAAETDRRRAGLQRQRDARASRAAAVRGALSRAAVLQERAQREVGKRVRDVCERSRAVCAAADAELERATARQILDWQSRRWADGWRREWAAARSAGILSEAQ